MLFHRFFSILRLRTTMETLLLMTETMVSRRVYKQLQKLVSIIKNDGHKEDENPCKCWMTLAFMITEKILNATTVDNNTADGFTCQGC